MDVILEKPIEFPAVLIIDDEVPLSANEVSAFEADLATIREAERLAWVESRGVVLGKVVIAA